MIARRRRTDDGDHDANALNNFRTVVYVLVIAAAIAWLAPLMFAGGAGVGNEGDGGTQPLEPSGALAKEITAAMNDTKAIIMTVINILRLVLTFAALVSIGIMRVRIRHITTPPHNRWAAVLDGPRPRVFFDQAMRPP